MNKDRDTFLRFSSALTGYGCVDLEGTGLVDLYFGFVEGQLGPKLTPQFYTLARLVVDQPDVQQQAQAIQQNVIASTLWWKFCSTLIQLWYLGSWTTLAASWYASANSPVPNGVASAPSKVVPSAQAYTQQLAFRAAGAHAPGTSPTGYGSWSIPPVFGDNLGPITGPI